MLRSGDCCCYHCFANSVRQDAGILRRVVAAIDEMMVFVMTGCRIGRSCSMNDFLSCAHPSGGVVDDRESLFQSAQPESLG